MVTNGLMKFNEFLLDKLFDFVAVTMNLKGFSIKRLTALTHAYKSHACKHACMCS